MADDFRPAALLRHTRSGAGDHLDLLLALRDPSSPDDRCAVGWRCTSAVHSLHPGGVASLEPTSLHRAFYLSLADSCELDGGRGRVEPLCRGRWRPQGACRAELAWSPHGAPWVVSFCGRDGRPVDPADAGSLSSASRLERLT